MFILLHTTADMLYGLGITIVICVGLVVLVGILISRERKLHNRKLKYIGRDQPCSASQRASDEPKKKILGRIGLCLNGGNKLPRRAAFSILP